jgi:hypothetical protein
VARQPAARSGVRPVGDDRAAAELELAVGAQRVLGGQRELGLGHPDAAGVEAGLDRRHGGLIGLPDELDLRRRLNLVDVVDQARALELRVRRHLDERQIVDRGVDVEVVDPHAAVPLPSDEVAELDSEVSA